MEKFVHGRVIFAGDSAHGVSPFGARGANSGVQDAENLAWKLDWVIKGQASSELLQTYGHEREFAADENILNSTRATDFITPKSEISRIFRDEVLHLAREHDFARRIVNSGRLSVPATLSLSPLNTADIDVFTGPIVPGAPLADAPVSTADGSSSWLLRSLKPEFNLVVFGEAAAWMSMLSNVHILRIGIDLIDTQELVTQRLDATPGAAYLIRPDQHVCARWRHPTETLVISALTKASCKKN
jgi:3-(3-hydroxy-phenyl)propionate hydroxylase